MEEPRRSNVLPIASVSEVHQGMHTLATSSKAWVSRRRSLPKTDVTGRDPRVDMTQEHHWSKKWHVMHVTFTSEAVTKVRR